jgi:hypothetical protein
MHKDSCRPGRAFIEISRARISEQGPRAETADQISSLYALGHNNVGQTIKRSDYYTGHGPLQELIFRRKGNLNG